MMTGSPDTRRFFVQQILLCCIFLASCSQTRPVFTPFPEAIITAPLTTGKTDFFVTCITERHGSPGGQQEQVKVLQRLLASSDLPLLLAIEGADNKKISLSFYQGMLQLPFIPELLMNQLRDGRLTAAEFLALTTNPDRLQLVGVEDHILYQQIQNLLLPIRKADFTTFYQELNQVALQIYLKLDKEQQQHLNNLLKGLRLHQFEFTSFIRKLNYLYQQTGNKIDAEQFPLSALVARYWELVDKRTTAFTTNLRQWVKPGGRAVLITGRYHQELLFAQVKQAGYRFQGLDIPEQSSRGTATENRSYVQAIKKKPAAMEAWLTSASLRPAPVIDQSWYQQKIKLLAVAYYFQRKILQGTMLGFKLYPNKDLSLATSAFDNTPEKTVYSFQLLGKSGKLFLDKTKTSPLYPGKFLEQGRLAGGWYYTLITSTQEEEW